MNRYSYLRKPLIKRSLIRKPLKNIVIISIVTFLMVLSTSVGASVTAESAVWGASNVVQGIVEENNPGLGYITLYNQDGTGTGNEYGSGYAQLRTFNYSNAVGITIYKNNKAAGINSIQAGDKAYIRVDASGRIISISAADNLYPRYGKIIYKSGTIIEIMMDDGYQQIFRLDKNITIIKNKKPADASALKAGSRVRLLCDSINKSLVRVITVENDIQTISSIYKGDSLEIDAMTLEASVLNMKVLRNSKWELLDRMGFTHLRLSEDCRFYYRGTELELLDAAEMMTDKEAYIAVRKISGNRDMAVMVTFKDRQTAPGPYYYNNEVIYRDTILRYIPGSGSIMLDFERSDLNLDAGTIIVKDGKLVSEAAVAAGDKVIIAANYNVNGNYSGNFASRDLSAGVIWVEEKRDESDIQLYRGIISFIDDGISFTVESYSIFNGESWIYFNIPMTFRLTADTRLFTDNGISGLRNFVGYGSDNYKGKAVYIAAAGDTAVAVSTASYGFDCYNGTVYGIQRSSAGGTGSTVQSFSYSLRDVFYYDNFAYVWRGTSDITVNLLKNSIILKNGSVIKPDGIEKGDILKVIAGGAGAGGTEAYIVIIDSGP